MTSNREYNGIAELTLPRLFTEPYQYIIPLYQRNYAWEETEIGQLLRDILDSSGKSNYYLGSLVVSERCNGKFEVIDGQQRFTTLCILLAVLKNEFKPCLVDKCLINTISTLNLYFESRPSSSECLKNLFSSGLTHECAEPSMKTAYLIIKSFLSADENDFDDFIASLVQTVKLLRVDVPKGTDLNHYFEVMNNRGEQLEKHEILKATLMASFIKADTEPSNYQKHQQHCFAMIWDACANMNRYAINGFCKTDRDKVFSESLNNYPDSFAQICNQLQTDTVSTTSSSESDKARSLRNIISEPKYHKESAKNLPKGAQRFASVINFPNFLLHVLRLQCPDEDIKLDDKQLLQQFINERKTPIDAGIFAINLLKSRLLFDRYVIKREHDKDWTLKTFKNGKSSLTPVNSLGTHELDESEDSSLNTQVIMLQSMFHVSYPAQAYKHWLGAVLDYLNQNIKTKIVLDGSQFANYLELLSDRFFFGRMSRDKEHRKSYEELVKYNAAVTLPIDTYRKEFSIYSLENKQPLHNGTDVHNFIFNRLDYLLWKKAGSKAWLEKQFTELYTVKTIAKAANEFKFTFRSSVEHYFPQHPISGDKFATPEGFPHGVDSFANLCLISGSKNSKLSNHLPNSKKEFYQKSDSTESLKQMFMMSYDCWGNESKEALSNVKKHQEMMIGVLCS